MAWLRCGKQKDVIIPPHLDDDDTINQPTPIPQPVPVIGKTKPDRLFSHPVVPLGSKNYLGQYYYEVPNYEYSITSGETQPTLKLKGTINGVTENPGSGVKISRTFIPELGTVFSTPGVHTVRFIYDATYTSNYTNYPMTYHVHREVSQDIAVVDHGVVVEEATNDCPCDVYSDGYGFFRPPQVSSVAYNWHSVTDNSGYSYSNVYNYMHYYPKTGQTVAVNKISCLPWYVRSLGLGQGEYYYVSSNGNGAYTSGSSWDSRYRQDNVPSQYLQYEAFLNGDGITPIDISEFSTWSSFYWMTRIDQLFNNVGSVTNYQTLANWNVYKVALLSTFQNVGFTSEMFASCIANWNVKATIAMSGVFLNCTGITNTNFLTNWDVGRVSTFSHFFQGCTNLVDLTGIKDWNVRCPCFNYMFYNCTSLSDLTPLTNWGLSYHYDTYYRFKPGSSNDCFVAEDGVICGDYSIGNAAIGLSGMFGYCQNLRSLNGIQNLTKSVPARPNNTDDFITTSTTGNYLADSIFAQCQLLTDITALSNWNAAALYGPSIGYNYKGYGSTSDKYYSSSTTVRGAMDMFSCCRSLTDISPLEDWDTREWQAITGMFSSCTALSDISPLANWNLDKCEFLINVFQNCVDLQDVSPLSSWGSHLNSLRGVAGLLAGCLISSLNFLSTWSSTYQLQNIAYMLEDVRYTGLDLTGFNGLNTVSIKQMESCFNFAQKCTNRKTAFGHTRSIYVYPDESDPNLYRYCYGSASTLQTPRLITWEGVKTNSLHGLENVNVTKVQNMGSLFKNFVYLQDISALSTWTTSSLTSVYNLFYGDKWLSDISALANWDTSNMVTMSQTFYNTSVTNISPLNNWDKSKVAIFKEYVPATASYPAYWRYYNDAEDAFGRTYLKAFSSTLDQTVLVTGARWNGVELVCINVEDLSGETHYIYDPTTLTFEGQKDAADAASWNFTIPSDYNHIVEVFNPFTTDTPVREYDYLLTWINPPVWNQNH